MMVIISIIFISFKQCCRDWIDEPKYMYYFDEIIMTLNKRTVLF